MIRDYSEKAEERLVMMAKRNSSEGWLSDLWDLVQDLTVHCMIGLDLVKPDGAFLGMKTDLEIYQGMVVDAERLSEEKIRKIFTACREKDAAYGSGLEASGNQIETMAASIGLLAAAIDPSMSVLSSESMMKLSDSIQKDMKTIKKDIDARMEASIKSHLENITANASSDFLKDLFDVMYHGASLILKPNNPFAIYDMVDALYAIGHDAEALLAAGFVLGSGVVSFGSARDRTRLLDQAEESYQLDGIADHMQREARRSKGTIFETPYEKIANLCELADTASKINKVVSGIKGIGKLVSPQRRKDVADVIRELEDANKTFKRLRILHGIGNALEKNKSPAVIIEKTNPGKANVNIFKLYHTIEEYFSKPEGSCPVNETEQPFGKPESFAIS